MCMCRCAHLTAQLRLRRLELEVRGEHEECLARRDALGLSAPCAELGDRVAASAAQQPTEVLERGGVTQASYVVHDDDSPRVALQLGRHAKLPFLHLRQLCAARKLVQPHAAPG